MPGSVERSTLLEGSATVLPRLERARFMRGYDAVLEGRGAGDEERPLHRDLGCGLMALYVRDAGWRFHYLVQGQLAQWDTDLSQIHEVARSNLYHRAPMDPDELRVTKGDGYDAARVLLTSDVFFTIGSRQEGVPVSLPGRDTLLIGPESAARATLAAFHEETYPLASRALIWRAGALHARSGER